MKTLMIGILTACGAMLANGAAAERGALEELNGAAPEQAEIEAPAPESSVQEEHGPLSARESVFGFAEAAAAFATAKPIAPEEVESFEGDWRLVARVDENAEDGKGLYEPQGVELKLQIGSHDYKDLELISQYNPFDKTRRFCLKAFPKTTLKVSGLSEGASRDGTLAFSYKLYNDWGSYGDRARWYATYDYRCKRADASRLICEELKRDRGGRTLGFVGFVQSRKMIRW